MIKRLLGLITAPLWGAAFVVFLPFAGIVIFLYYILDVTVEWFMDAVAYLTARVE